VINHLVNQRYEVLESAGQSAFFSVVKARDTSLDRIVAMKTLRSPFSESPDFVDGLMSGLGATRNLNHPNIAALFEVREADGVVYCITEFVRGVNLKERIRRIAPFTLSVAVDFACSIAEAIKFAHSVGQVHGDLRPQNVIVTPEGPVKVTDFGLQRAIARCAEAQTAKLVDAAPYHAPELSTKLPGTASADIYALGAIFYEMLTGTPLYAGETPEATAEMHALSPIPSPRSINPAVPRSVEGIVLKCLQKRPEYRYAGAADLLNDLKSVRDALRFGKPLSWSPIEVPPEPPPAPAPRPAAPPPPPPVREPEPAPEAPAAPIEPVAMPRTNRLRAADERVSIYIKIAIGMVMALIFAAGLGFVGVYMSYWMLPKPETVPGMVGKPIADVRQMAVRLKVHLIEHGEYRDDKPRGIVYMSDRENGVKIRPGQTVNVWYNKGPAYVNVPNLVKMTVDQAKKALEDSGLALGRAASETNDDIPPGYIIRQDPPAKQRVFHDKAVDIVSSSGPKHEALPDDAAFGLNHQEGQNDTGTADNGENGNQTNDQANNGDQTNGQGDTGQTNRNLGPAHTFHRTITIPSNDNIGVRTVRIQYRDAEGWHDPVVDEPHDGGDKIHLNFEYYGKYVTLRIFYDDKFQSDIRVDPQK
jgi:serine/threonine-protein kinase